MSDQPHHIRPTNDVARINVTPESAGWRDTAFAIIELPTGSVHEVMLPDRELAATATDPPLGGAAGRRGHDLGQRRAQE